MIINTAAQQLERIKILLIKAKKETDFIEIINLSYSFFKEEFFKKITEEDAFERTQLENEFSTFIS